jgi:cysteinyl-tRNA synthetase
MRLFALLAAILIAASCAGSALAAERENPYLKAKNWGYQLRNLEAGPRKVIANSIYDLVVIDHARGEDRKEIDLTKEEVAELQRKPDGSRRQVIAYFSIGESEDYRYYWKKEWDTKRPSWMGKENKDWKHNFVVQYWNTEWHKILFGSPDAFLDRIIAAGFDGVYLDRVDAYYFFGDDDVARGRMVDLIKRLAAYAREKKPGFTIMAQNAEELLDRPDYIEAIDGIAKESLLFGIKGLGKPNPRDDIVESTALLQKASKAGKAIFVVEYLQDPGNIQVAARRINDELGWALYIGTKGLSQLAKSPLTPAAPLGDEDDRVGTEPAKKKKK